MRVTDALYGDYEITEPILIELLHHPALLRLKGVAQHGLPEQWYPELKTFSRFEHSVGVLLLLRKMGASLNEQVAGLLHDVSHTVFSHVIDWVYQPRGCYQDTIHEKYLLLSGLAQSLASHGFDYQEIADYKRFGLLEQASPHICADRVDYTLRELFLNNKEEVALRCVDQVAPYSGRLVFKSQDSAKLFAHNYLERSLSVWAHQRNAAMYVVLAKVLSRALTLDLLSQKDLFKDDGTVLEKLHRSGDAEILAWLAQLERGDVADVVVGEAFPKFRYVDPLFLDGLQLKQLSEVDSEFTATLEYCRSTFLERYHPRVR